MEQKNDEAELSEDAQHEIHVAREKFAPMTLRTTDARNLQGILTSDAQTYSLWCLLERNDSIGTFIQLSHMAREGKLQGHTTFIDICTVLAEQIRRQTDSNSKLKHGIRYPQSYLHFMTLMRSYGQRSATQYDILRAAIGGPCPRTLRYE